jgi:nicotinic acid mononucleotide adenylyltransferase
MREIINQINESNIFVRLFEVGAGVPIANEFFNYAGASKTIYSSESYYSRDAYQTMFGESKSRAVSAEKLKDINDNVSIQKDLMNGIYNTVLSTTFQVGDKTNKISTHGWISLNINSKNIRYYHISLHYPNSRKGHIKNIGEIGILLLHSKNETIPNNCNVDIVLDENLQPLYHETLEFLSNCKNTDMMSVFTKNGSIDRLESITRDVDNLIVYKGSFNPPSISHKDIIQNTSKLFNGNKKEVFCLSYNTFQKGKQTVESFMDRVRFLNKMGWDVIITSKPLFKNTYDFIRLKYDGKIIFPQGIDTINRMVEYYINHSFDKKNKSFNTQHFLNDFKNTEFVIFYRDGENVHEEVQKKLIDGNLVSVFNESLRSGVSSTMIRNLVNQGEYEKIKELVPPEIYSEIISKKF